VRATLLLYRMRRTPFIRELPKCCMSRGPVAAATIFSLVAGLAGCSDLTATAGSTTLNDAARDVGAVADRAPTLRLGLASSAAFAAFAASDLFSVMPTGIGASPTTYTYTALWGCEDKGFFEPIVVIVDNWKATAGNGTGGHNHDATIKPLGNWTPVSGATAGDGIWTSVFTSPAFSGSETVEYKVTGATRCTGTATATFSYSIGVPGLAALGAGTGYTLIGQTGTHPDNHYGAPDFNTALLKLAQKFTAKHPSTSLGYNDMSLAAGGQFDCFDAVGCPSPWQFPHKEHRIGRNVDLRISNLTAKQRKTVQAEWVILKGSVHVEGNHWHLRF
jgi:hypothetical protein